MCEPARDPSTPSVFAALLAVPLSSTDSVLAPMSNFHVGAGAHRENDGRLACTDSTSQHPDFSRPAPRLREDTQARDCSAVCAAKFRVCRPPGWDVRTGFRSPSSPRHSTAHRWGSHCATGDCLDWLALCAGAFPHRPCDARDPGAASRRLNLLWPLRGAQPPVHNPALLASATPRAPGDMCARRGRKHLCVWAGGSGPGSLLSVHNMSVIRALFVIYV